MTNTVAESRDKLWGGATAPLGLEVSRLALLYIHQTRMQDLL